MNENKVFNKAGKVHIDWDECGNVTIESKANSHDMFLIVSDFLANRIIKFAKDDPVEAAELYGEVLTGIVCEKIANDGNAPSKTRIKALFYLTLRDAPRNKEGSKADDE